MKRRDFLKLTLAMTGAVMMPQYIMAEKLNLDTIHFSVDKHDEKRQTIIIFLAGGPSPLSGNLSNLEEINTSSQQSYYSHFGSGYLNIIEEYNLWKEAGGEAMKELLDNNQMTLIRTCYSETREVNSNKAHGVCTEQNKKGTYNTEDKPGILTNLARLMKNNNRYDELKLPFVTLQGKDNFYDGDPTDGLNPIAVNYSLSNPFQRSMTSSIWYTAEERKGKSATEYQANLPQFDHIMDEQARKLNNETMNQFLDHRTLLDNKIRAIHSKRDTQEERNGKTYTVDKNLKAYNYNPYDSFNKALASSIEILIDNPDTRTITMGTAGLGGWDDHSYAKVTYTRRMQNLFQALKAGMAHLEGEGKANSISIMVFGEFGRNVNLNNAYGWDHGNLQNLYILGGSDYFNHVGGTDAIVGTTYADNGGMPKSGRIWLKPTAESYICDPISIAATLYAIHGIENPEKLCDGFGVINPTVKGQDFYKG